MRNEELGIENGEWKIELRSPKDLILIAEVISEAIPSVKEPISN